MSVGPTRGISGLALGMVLSVSAGPLVAAEGSGREPELQQLLGLLAERAVLHRSLLYRFQCIEDLTRRVDRRPEFSHYGFHPEELLHRRYGIVLEQGEDGVASATREELTQSGGVRLSRKGEPVEANLPRQFDPVVKAVTQAQAAIFTVQGQADLKFRLVKDLEDSWSDYRIKCPMDHVAIEFLDREHPKPHPACSGQASGQMCVDPHNGEISALVFYALDRTVDGCVWNRQAPFAVVDQDLVETKTGARFPSRVKTLFSLDRHSNAVFEQRFEDCGFTHVEVKAIYGGVAGESGKP